MAAGRPRGAGGSATTDPPTARRPPGLRARLRRLVVLDEDDSVLVEAAPSVPLRRIVRRFWPHARPYRWAMLVVLGLAVAAPLLDAAMVWMFKLVVDDVLVPRDVGAFWWVAGAYVGLVLVSGLVEFVDDYLSTSISERFLLSLRSGVFRHLHRLGADFFERRRLGDLLTRLGGDIAAIESLVVSGLVDALSAVVRIGLFAGILFYISPELAVVALIVAPLFWGISRYFSRLVKAASRERRRVSGSLGAVAEESLANVALVQAYGREDFETERYRRQGLRAMEAKLTATRIQGLFGPLVDLVEIGGGLVVVAVGTYLLSDGAISLGGLLVFLVYLSRIYGPIRNLTSLVTALHSAAAGAERVIELLDTRPRVEDLPRARALDRARGAVTLDGVSFRYPGAAHPALEDVTLHVEPGELVALVGPSGAGKSTIAKLLLRFEDPTRGAVRLDGVDLRELSLESVRRNVTLLLQEGAVLDGTVGENILFGSPGATPDGMVAAAASADAHEFVMALPEGYETRVGQRGRRLSGGQRQRIAIARALARGARVLVLDEPTTGLDAAARDNVIAPLRRLMEGQTTIVVSHSAEIARQASRVVHVEAGRIVAEGTHDDLLVTDPGYARLWRAEHAPTPT